MKKLSYNVTLFVSAKQKTTTRSGLKEGDVYIGNNGNKIAVLHETKRSILTVNLKSGVVATSRSVPEKKKKSKTSTRKPTLLVIGKLNKNSLKIQ